MKPAPLIIASSLLLSCTAGPVYKGPKSDHFNGEEFVNRLSADKSFFDMLRVGVSYPFKKSNWPKKVVVADADPLVDNVQSGIAATVINHSTVLLQVDGMNILTDPVYSRRASPFKRLGPKRVIAPSAPIDDLPEIDVILISHNHYDHLDLDSLKKIIARDKQTRSPLILAGLGNGQLFENTSIRNYVDLDWGDSHSYGDTKFEFVETRHRSGRGLSDQMKTLWGGFVIQSSAGNIYFGGDTGYGPHFKEANEKFGDFDLALIPIGAYEPRWFMAAVHLNPDDAVLAHQDLGSRQSIAIHHSTFQLTYESIDRPKIDLRSAIEKYGVDTSAFIAPGFGKRFVVN